MHANHLQKYHSLQNQLCVEVNCSIVGLCLGRMSVYKCLFAKKVEKFFDDVEIVCLGMEAQYK